MEEERGNGWKDEGTGSGRERHISKIYPQADHGESPVVHHGEIR